MIFKTPRGAREVFWFYETGFRAKCSLYKELVMGAFLRDRKSGVDLRPIEIRDAEICAGWRNDPENRSLLGVWLPCSVTQEEDWLKNILEQKIPPSDLVMMVEKEGSSIGVVGMHRIDWSWRCAIMGICVGEKDSRHKGIGTAAYTLMMRYAFQEMGLLVLESKVYTTNKPSICFHESLAFKKVGQSDPKALVDGRLVPVITYSMTQERWQESVARK